MESDPALVKNQNCARNETIFERNATNSLSRSLEAEDPAQDLLNRLLLASLVSSQIHRNLEMARHRFLKFG
jgi:hypothetical protein